MRCNQKKTLVAVCGAGTAREAVFEVISIVPFSSWRTMDEKTTLIATFLDCIQNRWEGSETHKLGEAAEVGRNYGCDDWCSLRWWFGAGTPALLNLSLLLLPSRRLWFVDWIDYVGAFTEESPNCWSRSSLESGNCGRFGSICYLFAGRDTYIGIYGFTLRLFAMS